MFTYLLTRLWLTDLRPTAVPQPTAAVTAYTYVFSDLTRLEQIILGRHTTECMTTDSYIGNSIENHHTLRLKLSGTIVF